MDTGQTIKSDIGATDRIPRIVVGLRPITPVLTGASWGGWGCIGFTLPLTGFSVFARPMPCLALTPARPEKKSRQPSGHYR